MSQSRSFHIQRSEALMELWASQIDEFAKLNPSMAVLESEKIRQILMAAQVHATLAVSMR